jgi:hypothetical protein
MAPLSIRITLLAGFAAIAMSVPAAASLTTAGSIQTRPVQAIGNQYAYDPAGPVGLNYKSKKAKSAKSKKTDTSGQAKSGDTKSGNTK